MWNFFSHLQNFPAYLFFTLKGISACMRPLHIFVDANRSTNTKNYPTQEKISHVSWPPLFTASADMKPQRKRYLEKERKTSCIMCQMSFVKCHVSPFMCHLSSDQHFMQNGFLRYIFFNLIRTSLSRAGSSWTVGPRTRRLWWHQQWKPGLCEWVHQKQEPDPQNCDHKGLR